MKKRLVAFLLVLIMVLGMLPVSAFAADDGVSPQALESNETQTIKYQILYVGDEFNTGYSYGVSVLLIRPIHANIAQAILASIIRF